MRTRLLEYAWVGPDFGVVIVSDHIESDRYDRGVRVEWVEDGWLGGGEVSMRGSVTELLVGGPYPDLSPSEVPPLAVINEMLAGPGGPGMK